LFFSWQTEIISISERNNHSLNVGREAGNNLSVQFLSEVTALIASLIGVRIVHGMFVSQAVHQTEQHTVIFLLYRHCLYFFAVCQFKSNDIFYLISILVCVNPSALLYQHIISSSALFVFESLF